MRQLLVIALVIGFILLLRWLARQPPKVRWRWGLILVAIVLIGLVITGKLHWLFAAIGVILPIAQRLLGLLSYLPLFKKIFGHISNDATHNVFGQQSTIRTPHVHATLDQDTGDINGVIVSGLHKDQELKNLSMQNLVQLYREYLTSDSEAAQLIELFLNQKFGHQWRSCAGKDSNRSSRTNTSQAISKQEAYEILGLNKGASREDIIEAHRKLMQKLHPDRGGTTCLASKINQAKDTLLS